MMGRKATDGPRVSRGDRQQFEPPLLELTDDVIGPFQDQQTDLRKFTQEVRLASPSNEKFEWMVGGYYTHEEGTIDQFIGGVNYANGEPLGVSILDTIAVLTLESDYKEIAGFANVTWHVTDRFDITGGGRLAKNDQSATQSSSGNPILVGPAASFSTDSDESVFTYAVSPRFELSDNTAVYARIAKGYRPGGPNVLPSTAGDDVPHPVQQFPATLRGVWQDTAAYPGDTAVELKSRVDTAWRAVLRKLLGHQLIGLPDKFPGFI